MLGLQLFHSADEKDESEFPYRRSHGHSFRQYEVTDTGNMTHDLSPSSCLSQSCDLSAPLMQSVTLWALNLMSFLQILDSELFELMHQNGDYTHFYFCYRWFLLDFKRGNHTQTLKLSLYEDIVPSLFNWLFILCLCQSYSMRTSLQFGR